MRPLLVGEAPARTTVGARPLGGRVGRRLAELADVPELRDAFDAVNLLDRWPGPAASKGSAFPAAAGREAAAKLRPRLLRRRRVILVGRRVAGAFGLGRAPYLTWSPLGPRTEVAVLPHPSGVSRWWNDHRNVVRAAVFLRELSGSDACIDWPGATRSAKGYGGVRHEGRVIGAHRWAWLEFCGEIPDGKQVLHRCDRPPCVNPLHLFLGTPLDNTADAIQKKGRRFNQTRDHCAGCGCHHDSRTVGCAPCRTRHWRRLHPRRSRG